MNNLQNWLHAAGKFLVGLFLLYNMLSSLPARAFNYLQTCETQPVVWGGNAFVPPGRAVMSINTTSFPPDSDWDKSLQSAMWHWNNVKGAKFYFLFNRDTDGTIGFPNGVNEIGMPTQWTDSESTLAVTRTRTSCGRDLFGNVNHWIEEADIRFNPNKNWGASPYYFDPSKATYSFEATALHELGHVLGLGHEDRSLATMNTYYPDGGFVGNYQEWDPLPDDRQGVRRLYADATVETDIAASNFRDEGTGTAAIVAPPSPSYLSPGDSVLLEYTFHNLGTTLADFDIGFMLSRDKDIANNDYLLAINRGALADPGSSGTYQKTVKIPPGTSGYYYLGVLLDPNNTLAEANETNNAINLGEIYVKEALNLLTVNKVGNGKVTSSPVGIDCGTDCTESYSSTSTVTLVATPDTGYNFSGWLGACTNTSVICTVAMSTTNSVTATFSADCVYSLSPTSQNVASDATMGTISVTAGSGCTWAATSNASWLTVIMVASGNGNDIVAYSVAANTGSSSRTGTLTIGNQTFTVTQAGAGCSYTLSPASQAVSAGATAGTVSVTVDSGCAWTATSNTSWLTIISGTSGSSSGTVVYSISANTGSSTRTGTLSIAGQTFTVTQSGTGGTSAWTQLPGASPSRPSLALNPGTGKNQMVVRSASDQLWAGNFNAGGTFEGWNQLPGASPSPVAQAWHSGVNKLYMVVRSASDQLWASAFNASGVFEGWSALPGTSPSPVALAWHPTTNKLFMVARSATDQLWLGTFNAAGSFEGWNALPGASPSPVALAWNPALNKMQMVVHAASDQLYQGTFNAAGSFEGWNALPGSSPSPAALAWNPVLNKMQMAVRATNDQLYHGTFNAGGSFEGWNQLDGASPTEPSLAATLDGLLLVVRSSNDQLWSMLLK